MKTPKIYIKGNSKTPHRFWQYVLITDSEKKDIIEKYENDGFVFSESSTNEYIGLSETDKNKINFYSIH